MDNSENIQRACSMLLEAARILSPQVLSPVTPSSTAATAITMSRSGQPHQSLESTAALRNEMISPSEVQNSGSRFAHGDHQNWQTPRSAATCMPGSSRGLNELRSIFSPYPTTSAVGRPTFRRSVVPAREWRHDFYCLSGPDDSVTPSPSVKAILQENGLGAASVTTVTADSQELSNALTAAYPKLLSMDFELLRAIGGGIGKPFRRIMSDAGIPAVRLLITSRVGLIYIKPFTQILDLEEFQAINPCPDSLINENQQSNSGIPETESVQAVDLEEAHSNIVNTSSVTELSANNILASSESPGGFSFVYTPPISTEDEIGTIEEYRAQMYRENPGIQPIFISRDDFLHQMLGLYMKDNRFDIKKQPEVIFAGERGRDVGGLTREFFSKSLNTILHDKYNNRYSVFEGNMDHKLPSVDGYLLRTGIFKAVGKAMVHSFIHTGVAAFGMSLAVAEYLCTKEVDSDTPIYIDIEDISSLEAREVLLIINNWSKEADLKPEELTKLAAEAALCGFNNPLSYENRHLLGEIISSNNVINSRRAQLDEIKQAFIDSGSVEFLSERPHLWADVFPREKENLYTAIIILDQIIFEGGNEIEMKAWFKEYLELLETETCGIRSFLQTWTAWPHLTEEKLRVSYGEPEFMIHTCFNKIDIPRDVHKQVLFEHLRMATGGGFTSV